MTLGSSASAVSRRFGLAALLALSGCSARPKAEHGGPFLSILPSAEFTAARSIDARDPAQRMEASFALALGGLPPEVVPRLRERLEDAAEAALRRAEPALFDLIGSAEDDAALASDPLRQALPDLPALTAAANVLGAPWKAPGLSVEVGRSCAAAALRCLPLFASSVDRSDALIRRGRALAWTLTNAALLRVPASSRTHLVQSLRRAQTGPSSTIALVFDTQRGALAEEQLQPLREQASRALVHLPPDAPQRIWLAALGAVRASWELPIGLEADEVLVIPRLSVLARLQDFRAEVDLALRRP